MLPRVLIFCGPLLGPSETFIKAQALALRRFEPVFVGTHLTRGLSIPVDSRVLVNEGGFAGRMQELLFKSTLRPSTGLLDRLRQRRPKLVHAHFATNGVFALPVAEALNVPLLVTFHGHDVSVKETHRRAIRSWDRLYSKRKRRLIESDARYVAVSHFIKRQAVQQGYPSERISVLHIGTDLRQMDSAEGMPDERLILFVGRLVEKKGCAYLLEAVSAVQRRLPDVRAVVIGDGPLREPLQREATRLNLSCDFLGVQPHESVQAWIRRARVVCVPSVIASSGDAEGLPIIVYESMVHGRPVVGFASAGIPEAVMHERTGLLSPERNVEALAGDLHRTLTDDLLWTRLAAAARSLAETEFDLHRQTQRLELLYDDLIASTLPERARTC